MKFGCIDCGSGDDLIVNARFVRRDGSVSIHYLCRTCKAARMRKYRKTTKGKRAIDRARHADNARNPEKKRARAIVSNAIEVGSLTPEPCSRCGSLPAHAHHPDYSKPLEIVWLCPLHHKEAHRPATFPTPLPDRRLQA